MFGISTQLLWKIYVEDIDSDCRSESVPTQVCVVDLISPFVAGMQQYVLHRTADWLSSRHGPIVIPLPAVHTHFIAAARGLIIHGNSHSVWKTALYLSLLRYHYQINNAVQIKGTVQRIKEDRDRQKKDNLSSCKTH